MPGLESTVDMFDLRMSDKAKPLFEAVKKFIAEEVEPNTEEFFRLGEGRERRRPGAAVSRPMIFSTSA